MHNLKPVWIILLAFSLSLSYKLLCVNYAELVNIHDIFIILCSTILLTNNVNKKRAYNANELSDRAGE